VSKINKTLAKEYMKKYSSMIEKHKTFVEVYNPEGKPHHKIFYYADEAMIWAAMHLSLSKKLL
ncbi:MAG: hypothetical protein ABIB43_02285, partial [archaeon]